MRFERLTPMIWTNDLKATVDFYVYTLGFETDEYREDWHWAHLHRDETAIMIVSRTVDKFYDGQPKYTGSFYFYVDAVDELWNELKEKTKIFYDIANFPHRMREFGILDNNGYILQFGRELLEGEEVTECD
ncbi:MAG: VOC family protein [Chitinophagaceae bacterium]|nr:VOC family protein [Chitinophagaceae bacterium]